MRIDIYCKIVDNYGDAGVCLRLARGLAALGHKLRLLCDDLTVLRTIAAPDDEHILTLLPFEAQVPAGSADAVVAAFLCRLPEPRAQDLRHSRVPVIFLDYLSAEKWVEDFHGLRSPLDFPEGYYFYPGFTDHTGGLMLDPRLKELCAHRRPYLQDGIRRVTLFSYHNQELQGILELLSDSRYPSQIKVFTGLPLDNLNRLLSLQLQPGERWQSRDGKLSFTVSRMVSQERYDEILVNSDFNLVRGEDSIVRAMCCGRPFLWQIYPQSEDTHIVKLQAFMDLFKEKGLADPKLGALIDQLQLYYNQHGACPQVKLDDFEAAWQQWCGCFQCYLFALPNLAQSLSEFILKKIDV